MAEQLFFSVLRRCFQVPQPQSCAQLLPSEQPQRHPRVSAGGNVSFICWLFRVLIPDPACVSIAHHKPMLSHQGTPEIKEHYIDSKKDVDRHLKSSCEQFIQQQTHMFVGNLEEFLTKVKIHSCRALWVGNSAD